MKMRSISSLWTLLLIMNFTSCKRNKFLRKTGEQERMKRWSSHWRNKLETEDVLFPVHSLASCLIFTSNISLNFCFPSVTREILFFPLLFICLIIWLFGQGALLCCTHKCKKLGSAGPLGTLVIWTGAKGQEDVERHVGERWPVVHFFFCHSLFGRRGQIPLP